MKLYDITTIDGKIVKGDLSLGEIASIFGIDNATAYTLVTKTKPVRGKYIVQFSESEFAKRCETVENRNSTWAKNFMRDWIAIQRKFGIKTEH